MALLHIKLFMVLLHPRSSCENISYAFGIEQSSDIRSLRILAVTPSAVASNFPYNRT